MRTQVVISGGGVAGLTLALKLAQQQIHVIVLEKEKVPSIKYKGELLQPRTLVVLQQLGLLDQVLAHAQRLDTTSIVERSADGRVQKSTFDYGRVAHSLNYSVMINHEVLKKILLQALLTKETAIYLKPYKFLDLGGWDGQAYRYVTAQCLTTDEEIQIEADYMIGAEGRHSPLRRALDIELKAYEYNHYFFTVSFPAPPSLTQAEMIVKGHRFLGLFPLQNQRVRTALLIKPEEYKEIKRNGLQHFYDIYTDLAPELDGYVQSIQSWKAIQLMIPVRHNAQHYVKANCALIGDAAHSVHPMAGEGMNLAIQDGDSLGHLLGWMYATGRTDQRELHWFEKVRKPRAEFMSKLSHQSALVYSYSYPWWNRFRQFVLRNMAASPVLHYKQMLNISGLGLWKETLVDRLTQIGLWPKRGWMAERLKGKKMYSDLDHYPWLKASRDKGDTR